jgi:hypothetical protein
MLPAFGGAAIIPPSETARPTLLTGASWRPLYDLSTYPYELHNIAASTNPTQLAHLHKKVTAIETCHTGLQCWTANTSTTERRTSPGIADDELIATHATATIDGTAEPHRGSPTSRQSREKPSHTPRSSAPIGEGGEPASRPHQCDRHHRSG